MNAKTLCEVISIRETVPFRYTEGNVRNPRNMVQRFFHTLWHFPRSAAIAALTAYQHTLSPDHGPLRQLYTYGYCRYEPTCSEYGKRKLRERGFILGTLLLVGRVLSCHPFRHPSDEKLRKIIAVEASRRP